MRVGESGSVWLSVGESGRVLGKGATKNIKKLTNVSLYVCMSAENSKMLVFYVFFPTVVRGLVKKIKRHFLGIFPNMGGRGGPYPKTFVISPSHFWMKSPLCGAHKLERLRDNF